MAFAPGFYLFVGRIESVNSLLQAVIAKFYQQAAQVLQFCFGQVGSKELENLQLRIAQGGLHIIEFATKICTFFPKNEA